MSNDFKLLSLLLILMVVSRYAYAFLLEDGSTIEIKEKTRYSNLDKCLENNPQGCSVGYCTTTLLYCGEGWYDSNKNYYPPPECNQSSCEYWGR